MPNARERQNGTMSGKHKTDKKTGYTEGGIEEIETPQSDFIFVKNPISAHEIGSYRVGGRDEDLGYVAFPATALPLLPASAPVPA